jgi:amidohydrolase
MSLADRWRDAVRGELADAVALRHRLHAEPRLSGDELDTAALVTEAIGRGEGRPVAGTGRLVHVADGPGRPVLLRTELDALPVVESTGADYASGNGAMHACGHDVHMAALVAVCRAARRLDLPAPLVALLQPREEGADSGAQDVVAEGGLDGVDAVVAAHVQPALPPGVVAVTPGPVNASIDEFTITVHGQGGHSGYPHTVTDSVLALSTTVVALQQLGARRVDPVVGVACMVNQLHAGSANNVVPAVAVGSGTVRTMREDDRRRTHEALHDIASHVAAAHGCHAEVEIHRGEPPLVNDEHLATRAHMLLDEMGHEATADFRSFGSDDFANYSEHARVLMAFVGTGEATGRLHEATFLPDDRYVALVADALVAGWCAAVSDTP